MKSLCHFLFSSNRLGFDSRTRSRERASAVRSAAPAPSGVRPRNLELEEHRSTMDGSKDVQAALGCGGVEGSRREQAEIKNKTIGGGQFFLPGTGLFPLCPKKTSPPPNTPPTSSHRERIYIQKLNMPASAIRLHTDYTRSPAADPAGHHKETTQTCRSV